MTAADEIARLTAENAVLRGALADAAEILVDMLESSKPAQQPAAPRQRLRVVGRDN